MKHANYTREKHAPGARPALPHEKFPQVVEAIVQINLPKLGHVTVQFNHLISARSSCKSFSTRSCNRSPTQKTVRISLSARPCKPWAVGTSISAVACACVGSPQPRRKQQHERCPNVGAAKRLCHEQKPYAHLHPRHKPRSCSRSQSI